MKAELEKIRDRLTQLQREAEWGAETELKWHDVQLYLWRAEKELNDAIAMFGYMNE